MRRRHADGTQAAREAGNMVDLDSDPTKLIEVVDDRQAAADHPRRLDHLSPSPMTWPSTSPSSRRCFAALYPSLGVVNVMHLHSPQSAILSAIIFTPDHHRSECRCALRGVSTARKAPDVCCSASADLRSFFRRAWSIPLHFPSSAIDVAINASAGSEEASHVQRNRAPAIMSFFCAHAHHRHQSTPGDDGIAQLVFPYQANGSLLHDNGNGKVIGSELIGQNYHQPEIFPRPALGDHGHRASGKSVAQPYNAGQFLRLEPGAHLQALGRPGDGGYGQVKAENPGQPVPVDMVTTSASGLDPERHAGIGLFPGAAGWPRPANLRRINCARSSPDHIEGRFSHLRRAACQCAEAELALDASGSKYGTGGTGGARVQRRRIGRSLSQRWTDICR